VLGELAPCQIAVDVGDNCNTYTASEQREFYYHLRPVVLHSGLAAAQLTGFSVVRSVECILRRDGAIV
jgi:hypothetical protein